LKSRIGFAKDARVTPAPHPVESRTRHAEPCAHTYRNLTCAHYGSCLDLVVKRGWTDWSCLACVHFDQVRPVDLAAFAHDRRGHEG